MAGRPPFAGVPSLGLEQQAPKKCNTTNDEVASILKGLVLERKFFLSHLDDNQTKDPTPIDTTLQAEKAPESPAKRRLTRMKTKVDRRRSIGPSMVQKKATDFDIYLGEALMPVLAQALDSLCRQVNRMQMQGDSLDPKVRARFNPLTWLAQQLLRRHPKCSKTPRRQAIYANFRDWADLERGRREMLRRRDVIQEVFEGFVLRDVVQRTDVAAVLDSIDVTLRLDGLVKNNKAIRHALNLDGNQPETPSGATRGSAFRQPPRDREDFFKGGGWTFEMFWKRFVDVIMSSDVVTFSAFQNGISMQHQHALLQSEAEQARKKEDEQRKQQEAEVRRQGEIYTALHVEMMENEHIQAILTKSKVLTGDDVRPGDAGYEFEVPPNGLHVTLIARLLIGIGFETFDKSRPKARVASPGVPEKAIPLFTVEAAAAAAGAEAGSRWWDDELAAAWTVLQGIHNAEIRDGVVEEEILSKVLVPPVGYHLLRNKILEELELQDEKGALGNNSRRGSGADQEALNVGTIGMGKPSIETLCTRFGITLSRIEWLHRLFESFLQPDENTPDEAPVCLYPEKPAAIKKAQMRALIKEVRPNMEEVEFEMRFRRIDTDLSGMIEFDEFVQWVREDEVRVAGAAPLGKMSFEELAVVYGESVELIKYIFARFQDKFPIDERDNYPTNPRSLAKSEVRELVAMLVPDMTDADFEVQFQMTTFSQKEALEFDEFLEVLPLDDLPEEIREAHEPTSPH